MSDVRVRAAINLHAVLRNVADLCALDPSARALVADTSVKLNVKVPGLTPLTLSFWDGNCQADRADLSPHVRLWVPKLPVITLAFAGPAHFNAMVAGKALPIPVRGHHRLKFLTGPFTALTGTLERVLRPAPTDPLTPESVRIQTILTAYTAFYALAEVAQHDPIGRHMASRIADGTIAITIGGGPSVYLVCHQGQLRAGQGEFPDAKASMHFDSLDTAGQMLAGQVDTYACIGDGRLSISGFVPMIDEMNKLLGRVGRYLS